MKKNFVYEEAIISYDVKGSGVALILLHGFGEDKSVFDQQVNFLKNDCKVIVPDLPGSGESGLLLKENVGLEDYAGCIKAVLQNEGIEEAILLGHSMGGYITIAFAELYPKMLLGFGFIHSTAAADSEEKKEVRRKGIDLIKEYGAFSFLKNTTPNLFSNEFKQTHQEQVTAFIEKGKDFSEEALCQYYKAMMNRPDRMEVLKNTSLPVLFILGTEDVAASLKDVIHQTYLPKVSQINILDGVGHMGMLESPEKVNEHVLHFLELVTS